MPSTTVVSAVVILMVIQTIQLAPPGPNGMDDTPHVTSLDPTGADQSDAEHPPTDLAVGVGVPRGAQRHRRSALRQGLTDCAGSWVPAGGPIRLLY